MGYLDPREKFKVVVFLNLKKQYFFICIHLFVYILCFLPWRIISILFDFRIGQLKVVTIMLRICRQVQLKLWFSNWVPCLLPCLHLISKNYNFQTLNIYIIQQTDFTEKESRFRDDETCSESHLIRDTQWPDENKFIFCVCHCTVLSFFTVDFLSVILVVFMFGGGGGVGIGNFQQIINISR